MMRILLAVLFVLIPVSALAQPLWSTEREGVSVDHNLLDELFSGAKAAFTLDIDGQQLQVTVEKVSPPNQGVSSLRGRFQSQPDSYFLLCRGSNNATVALFQTRDGGAFKLDHSTGRNALHSVDEMKLGSCGGAINPEDLPEPTRKPHPPANPVVFDGREAGVADDGTRHDIVIGYTPGAEEVAGGYDYIMAEAQLAVDAANLTYDNSLINSELRLVHTMFTNYSESAAYIFIDHVYSLLYPNDGVMDDVMHMRDRAGADFASVLIDGRDENGDVPTCGMAPVMGSDAVIPEFETHAISIVAVQCAASVWTLAHEVGHNRGCAHDRANTNFYGAYSYSHGLRFYHNEENQTGLSTVMAVDHFVWNYTRVPHFSNPDVNYAGWPTGIPVGQTNESHNVLTHENTSALCAGFRAERTFVEFGVTGYSDGSVLFPHPSIAQAVIDSRQGGHIVLNNGDASFAGFLTEPRVMVHDGPESAVLGGN